MYNGFLSLWSRKGDNTIQQFIEFSHFNTQQVSLLYRLRAFHFNHLIRIWKMDRRFIRYYRMTTKWNQKQQFQVTMIVLPWNPSFCTVAVQLCCFYAHVHIPAPHLWPKSQIRRKFSCFLFTDAWLILPLDLADSTAKYNMLLAIPCRRADLATHKFAIYPYLFGPLLLMQPKRGGFTRSCEKNLT